MATAKRRDERRIFEHFVIAGLKKDAEHIRPTAQECGRRNTEPLAPITDICVIFPDQGETVPDGFEMIHSTPLAYRADLNHGSFLRGASCFLCFRRGYHKPPLIDIGVLDKGRGEKPMVDSTTVLTTPFGRTANVNNSSNGIFLTYRRAPANSAPSQLVVTHISVIIASKGEIPPHTYYKIPKNLNKGFVGSEVYICYKKSLGSAKRLAYKPAILDYFPKKAPTDDEEDGERNLLENVPLFCLPMGALIECWSNKCQTPERQYSTFVLTDEMNQKYYGASVTFYEKYTGDLSPEQRDKLGVEIPENEEVGGAMDDTASANDPAEQFAFHTNLSICIVSRYPFFHPFKRFLFYIHRMARASNTIHSVPIERYISHMMYEVSFPTLRRPRVLMQLGAEMVTFEAQDEQQLPQYGAALFEALKSLGVESTLYLFLLALLEQKILIHSLRPWLLTAVAETVCTLMFPFHWQCPYVPQCPLSLAGVLHAPLPFIAGVDSRYFDLYEDPPVDVTCFDLDTQTISGSKTRHEIKLSMVPKKPLKKLRASLDELNKLIQKQDFNLSQLQKGDFVRTDVEQQLQMKKKQIEIGIQEACLKFMASLMTGYQSFLRPIVSAPSSKSATDTGNLFDVEAFLRTRDKEKQDFYRRFCSTQSFIRFIEERSFVSDKSAYNAFFDDCIQKMMLADISGGEIGALLEMDASLTSNTVFIPPPEPLLNLDGTERSFKYTEFPRQLDPTLFQLDKLNIEQNTEPLQIPVEKEFGRCAAVRTKHEVRSSLLMASNGVRTQKLYWPRILVFYAYSLWFMQLPSMLALAKNKRKTLRLAFHVLARLEATEVIPLDQVCYRILIELCGQCGEPHLAVLVLHAMRRAGLEQNAVTYGLYHRAVMNAEWPAAGRVKADLLWRRLRMILIGMTHFRNRRRFTGERMAVDSASVSDPGYHSEATTTPVSVAIDETLREEDEEDRLRTAPFIITSTPLDESRKMSENREVKTPEPSEEKEVRNPLMPRHENADPLGALHPDRNQHHDHERQKSAPPDVGMSPARAKFLADHTEERLFKEEGDKKLDKEKKSGWFSGMGKNIANSPLMKMIRSQTTDQLDKKSINSDGSSDNGTSLGNFVASPSLHNIVSQVKKGYDEVVREGGECTKHGMIRNGQTHIVEFFGLHQRSVVFRLDLIDGRF
ncbi:unnamed protein product, partial [Mesorhabditis spiculigera]